MNTDHQGSGVGAGATSKLFLFSPQLRCPRYGSFTPGVCNLSLVIQLPATPARKHLQQLDSNTSTTSIPGYLGTPKQPAMEAMEVEKVDLHTAQALTPGDVTCRGGASCLHKNSGAFRCVRTVAAREEKIRWRPSCSR